MPPAAVLLSVPEAPPTRRTPVAPLTLLKPIWPLLVTDLPAASMATAAPAAVGFTEPAVSMVRLSGWPEAAVEVATGVVTAVLIVVSAWAAAAKAIGSAAAETNSRFMSFLLLVDVLARTRRYMSYNYELHNNCTSRADDVPQGELNNAKARGRSGQSRPDQAAAPAGGPLAEGRARAGRPDPGRTGGEGGPALLHLRLAGGERPRPAPDRDAGGLGRRARPEQPRVRQNPAPILRA